VTYLQAYSLPPFHIALVQTRELLLLLLQVIRLRKKLSGAADAVKGLFGVGKGNDEVVEKLERMQVRTQREAVCIFW
jgi:hypothetical protein